jgi:4-hydroxy-tetrahydrodipicolinate reductase
MIELAVAGATGRMGRCVMELAVGDERFGIAAALTASETGLVGTKMHVGDTEVTLADRLGSPCDVLIDFSVAAGTVEWLKVCERYEIPMVTGTTGHDEQQLNRIHEGARVIPIVFAPNFSLGIRAMRKIAAQVAKLLGDQYDVEVVEAHHNRKVDAPSGTALALVDDIAEATGRTRDQAAIFGRHGQVGERPSGQIGVHAIRMGDTVGQHEVHFSGQGETLTIRHTAHSRELFALGALRAAAWVVNQSPGFYTLDDVTASTKG